MKMEEKEQCPVCQGSGELPKPFIAVSGQADVQAMVKTLRAAGYSIRQIMKFVGYKSPRSVQKILMSKFILAEANRPRVSPANAFKEQDR